MNRAIVVKTYGDSEIAGAIVDGMSRAPAINAAELETVRAENVRLKELTGVRSYGDSVRLETACKALAVKSRPNQLDGCTGPFWARGRYCGTRLRNGWNISENGIGVDTECLARLTGKR